MPELVGDGRGLPPYMILPGGHGELRVFRRSVAGTTDHDQSPGRGRVSSGIIFSLRGRRRPRLRLVGAQTPRGVCAGQVYVVVVEALIEDRDVERPPMVSETANNGNMLTTRESNVRKDTIDQHLAQVAHADAAGDGSTLDECTNFN